MPGNVDVVRSIFADWERGDFGSADWADPEIEVVILGGPESLKSKGLAAMAEVWRGWLSGWEAFRAEAEEIRELDDGRVLVLTNNTGRGKISGLELGQTSTRGANVFELSDGKVTKLVAYADRDRALAELGLRE